MRKRNFENRYYAEVDRLGNSRRWQPHKVGRAVTLGGAVKAAFKRVLDGEYEKCVVCDPIGSVQFVIRRAGNKLVTVTKGI